MNTLTTISGLAHLLGTHPSNLRYHVAAGNIAAPSHPVKERLCYNAAEVAALRLWWSNRVPLGVSRFTKTEIDAMRIMYANGMTQQEIAERFGAQQPNISQYLTGEILPGWRGGATGRGRRQRQPQRQKRQRNKRLEPLP
jgi:hypothetical protein